MNNSESNFMKTKTIRSTSENGKNAMEGEDFDPLYPAFDRARERREINKTVLE